MPSLLITGGAGFIGTHLARRAVSAGHQVTILDNLSPQVHDAAETYHPVEGAVFRQGDVTNRADIKRSLEGIDAIIHLAAETGTGQSMYEIERYYAVNVGGTAVLFDALANQQHSVRTVLLASSRSVYGEGAYLCHECSVEGARRFPRPRSPEQLNAHQWTSPCPVCGGTLQPTSTREDDPVSPASIYAATKLAQEELVRVASRALGISHTIFRFQNVFGEGQSLRNPYTGILSIFSTRIRLGLPLPIFEDGEETRDFVHVADVVSAILACIDNPAADGATLNIGRGEAVSVMTVAQLLSRIMGSAIAPHVTGQYRIGDIRHNFADISRLETAVGSTPAITLEDGMRRFCEWAKTQSIPQDLLDKANSELQARKLMG